MQILSQASKALSLFVYKEQESESDSKRARQTDFGTCCAKSSWQDHKI